MADRRIRELERRAAAGDPRERVRLLSERLRAGELDRRRLRLAAYVGDAAAHAVLDWEALDVPEDLGPWFRGLAAWGEKAPLRAAVAAARLFLVVAPAAPGLEWDVVEQALAAAERCCAEPAAGRRREALAAADAVACGPARSHGWALVTWCAADLARSATGLGRDGTALLNRTQAVLEGVAEVFPETAIRRASGEALLAWALGASPAQQVVRLP